MPSLFLMLLSWFFATPVLADAPAAKTVKTTAGQTFRVVPREQLRVKQPGTRTMKSKEERTPTAALPSPPPVWDFTKADTISFPILGNDRYGDCFYAACAHAAQTWCGMNGRPAAFDVNALTRRYLKIAGGDNGLDDATIFPEFKGGIVGPSGPHRILDYMLVKPGDSAGLSLAGWAFGGWLYTCGLCSEWEHNSRPGATWDAGHSDPQAGHAMLVNGKNADGTWKLQTWGFNPPVKLTQKGLLSADPECVVCFSLEWFDPATGRAPNGLYYDDLAPLWVTLGGRQLPPSPFPPKPGPTPDPTPTPTPAYQSLAVVVDGAAIVIDPATKTVVLPKGWKTPGAVGAESQMAAAGVNPAVIADVLKLIHDVSSNAPVFTIYADLMKILADFTAGPPKAMPAVKGAQTAPAPRVLPLLPAKPSLHRPFGGLFRRAVCDCPGCSCPGCGR